MLLGGYLLNYKLVSDMKICSGDSIYLRRCVDVDGSIYYSPRLTVLYVNNCLDLRKFYKWFLQHEPRNGVYYKYTRLFFTYKGEKFYVSWVHYTDEFLRDAELYLKKLGCINIEIDYGELD